MVLYIAASEASQSDQIKKKEHLTWTDSKTESIILVPGDK